MVYNGINQYVIISALYIMLNILEYIVNFNLLNTILYKIIIVTY